MSGLARSLMLGLCGVGGIGAAIALAVFVEPPVEQPRKAKRPVAEVSHVATPSPIATHAPPRPAVTAQVRPADSSNGFTETVAAAPQALRSFWQSLSQQVGQIASQAVPPEKVEIEPRGSTGGQATSATQANKPVTSATPLPTVQLKGTSGAELARPPGIVPGASQISAEGDGRLTINLYEEDLRKVLELVSKQSGMNILATKSVTGTVTASLAGVGLEEALGAILKSTGYIWQRDGKFIYVGTQADFQASRNASDNIINRVYRPSYVTAKELAAMITPLLTEGVGKVTASTPSKTGIAADGNTAGGDDFAAAEAVVVRDYENVLAIIDQLVEEMDIRPAQVAIEAMILSVKLDDTNRFGVDWQFLREQENLRLGIGSPVTNLGQVTFDDGGLRFGFLDSNLGSFINALETIGDANIIATPKVLCLNRQRAEILIGAQLGYVNTTQTETSSTQAVDFLEVGTQLRIRPFISRDGMVRLEVHPELSTGAVRVEQNFTLPDKEVTQVTSNVMVRDGSTVVIGGLIRNELTETASQLPLFGSLPYVGWLFRNTTQSEERREILILITPHVVYEPEVSYQGDKAAREFHHRHMVYADKMSCIGKRLLGRKYFHRAQQAWQRGDQKKALHMINLSIDFDPMNRQAIDLRADISSNQPRGDHTDVHPPRVGPNLHPLDGELLSPWVAGPSGAPPFPLRHPVDPGEPGPSRNFDIESVTP